MHKIGGKPEQKIDSGLGGRIVLKWIVEKWVVTM
jgi:hypothetical protein